MLGWCGCRSLARCCGWSRARCWSRKALALGLGSVLRLVSDSVLALASVWG